MKTISFVIIALSIIILTGCKNKSTQKDDNNIEVGGLYIAQNKDGSYGVTKILALDDFAVHVRMYSNTFETKPSDLNSSDLKFFIGHAPMAKEGFLIDKPELLKIEDVSENELEGYKMYLEAMNNQ